MTYDHRIEADRIAAANERKLQELVQQGRDMVNRDSKFQFSGSDPRHCAQFGCRKVINEMYGPYCIDHQRRVKPDIVKHLNY